MAKVLDARVVTKAKLGSIRLTLNLMLAGVMPASDSEAKPGDPEPKATPTTWCQMASIDYAIHDASDAGLGQRTLTHQTVGVDKEPLLEVAVAEVSKNLVAWIRADRLTIADDAT